MTRSVKLADLPRTPRGKNVPADLEISADEIQLDDVLVIKRHLFRQCQQGNPWFEGEGDEDDIEKSERVVRKSGDLQRIRSIKEKVAALISSPMIDARPRNRRSQSEGRSCSLTPLRVPHKNDLLNSTSRELSRLILSRRSSVACIPTRPDPISPNPSRSRKRLNSGIVDKENIQPEQPTTDPDLTAINDFRLLAQVEDARLRVFCNDWNGVISEESGKLPESVVDSIRATVCKCQLVLQHKIPFFHSLVDMAERCTNGLVSDAPAVSPNDLAGYWDMVADEIKRADDSFDRLRKWRDQFNYDLTQCPNTPPRRPLAPKISSNRGRKTPKRIGDTKASKIPTRKSIRGREVKVDNLPKEAAVNLMTSAANKSAQKKPRVGSRFAEFLKAKKAATKESSGSSNPIMIYTPEASQPNDQSITTTNISTTALATNSHSFRTPGSDLKSMQSNTASNNSFIAPKQRKLQSDLKQKNLTSPKFTRTPNRPSLSSKPRSPSSGMVGQSSRIASTPLNHYLASTTLDFRTPKLPKSVQKSDTHLSTGSRPGTPRPRFKRKSGVLNYPDRVTLDSLLSSSMDGADKSLPTRTQPSRQVKRISFAPDLSHTPGGHAFGSGSPRNPYPITPANTSGSLVAASRTHQRKHILETLTPLGLRPVNARKSLSKTK